MLIAVDVPDDFSYPFLVELNVANVLVVDIPDIPRNLI
jgi:hypothetical protein